MGGSIAIAARFNDGQAICIDGWTNFIPNMVMNETTLSGDDSIVRELLLKVARHSDYAGPLQFRGHGYGIVVIDFVAREIHSKQGYTSFERKGLNQLLDINQSGWRETEGRTGPTHPLFPGQIYVNTIKDEAKGLLDAGRVRKVSVNCEPCEPVVLTQETVLAMLDADSLSFLEERPRTFVDVQIDTAPFTVHDYPEDGSLKEMKARLAASGFPMTKPEGLNAMLTAHRP